MGSDYLFAMPSGIGGAARTLDLGATFDEYNDSPSGEVADARALSSDWVRVGEAIKLAFDTVTRDMRVVERGEE